MPQTYMLRKIAERVLGHAIDNNTGWAAEQGQILESECIPWLELTQDISIRSVGLITNDEGTLGASPDGIIGDGDEAEGLEIKCPQPTQQLKNVLGGGIPKEYLAQVHGGLFVTGFRAWRFVSYHRQLPKLIVRIERDEEIMARMKEVLDDAQKLFKYWLDLVMDKKALEDAPMRAAQARRDAQDEAKVREAVGGGELPGEKWLREHAVKTTKE